MTRKYDKLQEQCIQVHMCIVHDIISISGTLSSSEIKSVQNTVFCRNIFLSDNVLEKTPSIFNYFMAVKVLRL